ncbi:MAG: hypothetical protein ACXVKQ_18490 [Acidimicrobiia bacterium]
MASALQCPACGHKHRLSELSGDPIFSCEQCGRLLKTPVEYRRPEPSSPSEPPRPSRGTSSVQRGGSATRDQTSVLQTPSEPAASAGAVPRPRRPSPRAPATLTLPLQILGWLVALVLGGVITRYFARFTGLLTGDSVIDLITGTGWVRYLRLFAVVPIWALVSAGLMTGFVEGARWWKSRQRSAPSTRRVSAIPAKPPRSAPPKPGPGARPPAPNPTAAETRSPSGAASTPRARRIPKRDISSES